MYDSIVRTLIYSSIHFLMCYLPKQFMSNNLPHCNISSDVTTASNLLKCNTRVYTSSSSSSSSSITAKWDATSETNSYLFPRMKWVWKYCTTPFPTLMCVLGKTSKTLMIDDVAPCPLSPRLEWTTPPGTGVTRTNLVAWTGKLSVVFLEVNYLTPRHSRVYRGIMDTDTWFTTGIQKRFPLLDSQHDYSQILISFSSLHGNEIWQG